MRPSAKAKGRSIRLATPKPKVSPSWPSKIPPSFLLSRTKAAQPKAPTAARPRPRGSRPPPISGVSRPMPSAATAMQRKWSGRREVATARPSGPRKAMAAAMPRGMYCSARKKQRAVAASAKPKSRIGQAPWRIRRSIFGREKTASTRAAKAVLRKTVPDGPRSAKSMVASAELSWIERIDSRRSAVGGTRPKARARAAGRARPSSHGSGGSRGPWAAARRPKARSEFVDSLQLPLSVPIGDSIG